MPYEITPSPVAPPPGSRLWTAGATAGVAVVVLLGLAALHRDIAGPLLAGAAVVALTAWALNRPSQRAPAPGSTAAATVGDADAAPLLADQTLLDELFETLADPVMVVSGGEADDLAARRVVLANAAARDLLRIPREGTLLVSALRDPVVLEAVDEALFGGVERTAAYAGVGAQTRHWRVMTRPLAPNDGHAMALVVLRDETDVRRMELMRVDFLANASHELRTPLASLSGFIETLRGHARDDPKARDKFLDIMATQADRMGRLVADLLSLSRIELNEHIPPSGRVDLARAASDVIDAVSVLSDDRQVRVVLQDRGASAPVHGDRDEIVQVVQNLVDNAIKYSAAGDAVEVVIQPEVTLDQASAPWSGGNRGEGATRLPLVTPDRETGMLYAAVTVRDHGPGMAREHLPRLTERFYRVEGQKSGERAGTGLGLAIVKHIVNRHRGGLTVESAPGQGSVFTAYFPVAAPKAS
ncbi:two-component system phosphate regulon sensor histidine kinase PhoR [Brevundimonas alba]|uniref:histidine kinase n=1 Tax=Brevundimonas alba TaxID=74314 RepID=A0A7X5YLH1_9CAUL|nr:ATP-binding protein [Brevundimonas alba]NJC41822.1 two-component system phosphate regulon sensor histidine kinase PhoR [Brevundimonas alba]